MILGDDDASIAWLPESLSDKHFPIFLFGFTTFSNEHAGKVLIWASRSKSLKNDKLVKICR